MPPFDMTHISGNSGIKVILLVHAHMHKHSLSLSLDSRESVNYSHGVVVQCRRKFKENSRPANFARKSLKSPEGGGRDDDDDSRRNISIRPREREFASCSLSLLD